MLGGQGEGANTKRVRQWAVQNEGGGEVRVGDGVGREIGWSVAREAGAAGWVLPLFEKSLAETRLSNATTFS